MKSRAIKHLVNRKLETMELQAAWDIVSEHLIKCTSGGHSTFASIVNGDIWKDYGYYSITGANNKILLKSTKNYRK